MRSPYAELLHRSKFHPEGREIEKLQHLFVISTTSITIVPCTHCSKHPSLVHNQNFKTCSGCKSELNERTIPFGELLWLNTFFSVLSSKCDAIPCMCVLEGQTLTCLKLLTLIFQSKFRKCYDLKEKLVKQKSFTNEGLKLNYTFIYIKDIYMCWLYCERSLHKISTPQRRNYHSVAGCGKKGEFRVLFFICVICTSVYLYDATLSQCTELNQMQL